MTELLKVSFDHGLGDCVNFAHVMAVYAQHGYAFKATCAEDKGIVLRTAASVCHSGCGASRVPWYETPGVTRENVDKPWRHNKAAISMNVAPLPPLGILPSEFWRELCETRIYAGGLVMPIDFEFVDRFIEALPKPLILVHTMGNTSQDSKSLSTQETFNLYESLLDFTPGSLLLLDWDNRVPRYDSPRVKHLQDDWRTLSTSELIALMYRADLLIGVDSGPIHLARMTPIKAIGVWRGERHFVSRYTMPTFNHINVMQRSELTERLGSEWNKAECDKLTGAFIAHKAAEVLGL